MNIRIKILYISILFNFTCFLGSAQQISQETARQVAEKFFRQSERDTLSLLSCRELGDKEKPSMYAFSTQNSWVLVAGNKKVLPILAYSDEKCGAFPAQSEMPEGMAYLLEWYNSQIEELQNDDKTSEYNKQWDKYFDADDIKAPDRNIIVSSLLVRDGESIAWKQSGNNGGGSISKSYNKFCPAGANCEHTKVGCGAVAIGQILWYWKWPYAAVIDAGGLSSVLHRYNWDAMPAKIYNITNDYNVDMIANLLHDCGVLLYTHYDCGESSSSIYDHASRVYSEYKYVSQKFWRKDYINANWLNMMKNELDNNRPILYGGTNSGGGHAFVLDGYDSDNKFHVNLGWGGISNGYYLLDSISGGNDPYTSRQHAIVAYPSPECSCLTIEDTTYNKDFVISQGNDIIFNNVQFSGELHGITVSNSSITLGPGTIITSNADVNFAISDVPCDNSRASMIKENIKRNASFQYANQWIVLTDCFGSHGYPYWMERKYSVVKDTVIGDYTYQLLNNDYQGCIRYSDDGMKFYYLSESGEYLLCDFSLQIGDTCYAYIGTATYKDEEKALLESKHELVQPWIIKGKEIIDNRIHVKMSYTFEDGGELVEFDTEMIQGIGSKHFIFPLTTSILFFGAGPSYTLCASNNNENIYSFDLTKQGIINDCPMWNLINNDVNSTQVQSTVQKIIRNGQVYILKNEKTYNVFGQETIK